MFCIECDWKLASKIQYDIQPILECIGYYYYDKTQSSYKTGKIEICIGVWWLPVVERNINHVYLGFQSLPFMLIIPFLLAGLVDPLDCCYLACIFAMQKKKSIDITMNWRPDQNVNLRYAAFGSTEHKLTRTNKKSNRGATSARSFYFSQP